MADSCCGVHAQAQDPTRTITLRRQFEQEFARRFRELRGRIRKEVLDEDGFALKANRGRFTGARAGEKIDSFLSWLSETKRQVLFGVPEGMPPSVAGREVWMQPYIGRAYESGVSQSAARMRAGGASVSDAWVEGAMRRERHLDRVGLVYTRVFEELEGISDALDQQISRALADGLAQGKGVVEITRDLNAAVDSIGRKRAALIARTEIIGAHAEASLNTYAEAGVEGVEVEAELSTAGDDRVCEQCASLEGRTYPIEEARGLIPVHPNCRCTYIPKITNGRDIELR